MTEIILPSKINIQRGKVTKRDIFYIKNFLEIGYPRSTVCDIYGITEDKLKQVLGEDEERNKLLEKKKQYAKDLRERRETMNYY